MISDEVLEKLADGLHPKYCGLCDGEEFEPLITNMARELLDARQKIDKLIANSERLAERLKEFVEAVGFTGAIDGAMALSITSKGLRGIEDNLNSHADLMRKIKVQDAIDKTISENTEAWKKLADE